ncbi:MAG TPA: flagellar assembly protein FliW [Jatrophihabitans sp.]|jgi:flagellar assembly factor FliW
MTTTAERIQQLEFVEPLPGFPDERQYVLSAIDDEGVLYSLRSVKYPELRFVLTPAVAFFAEYEPDLGPLAGVLGSDDADVLLMLTLGQGLADATANLRAPIVVSTSTGLGVQLILEDASLPMHCPILPQAQALQPA